MYMGRMAARAYELKRDHGWCVESRQCQRHNHDEPTIVEYYLVVDDD
jgi:hypothetical protein